MLVKDKQLWARGKDVIDCKIGFACRILYLKSLSVDLELLHLRNYDLVRCDRDLIFEELLAILLRFKAFDVRSLDAVQDTTLLGYSVSLALGWVHCEEVFGEVGACHHVLTKYFDKVSKVSLVVLQGDFLEHELHDLLLLIVLKNFDWVIDRRLPVPCKTDDSVLASDRV